jgi:hypothetical protein
MRTEFAVFMQLQEVALKVVKMLIPSLSYALFLVALRY